MENLAFDDFDFSFIALTDSSSDKALSGLSQTTDSAASINLEESLPEQNAMAMVNTTAAATELNILDSSMPRNYKLFKQNVYN